MSGSHLTHTQGNRNHSSSARTHLTLSLSCSSLLVLHNYVPHVAGTLETPFLKKEPSARAKTYPFVLDPFQETAIACLVCVG